MAELLPLFPLSLVVYPQEKLKLHIFEPRYKQLLHECAKEGITFGIPAVIEKKVMDIATEVRLVSIEKKYKSGELDIVTEGIGKVHISRFYREAHAKPYPGGDIERIVDNRDSHPEAQLKIFTLMQQLHQALGIQQRFDGKEGEVYSYRIAHQIGLNIEQEYDLLSLHTESERLGFILEHLEHILPVVLETERMKAKAKLNGHFKNVLPPDF